MNEQENEPLTEEEEDKLRVEIESALKDIQTRDDLIAFIELLGEGVERKYFETFVVESYLDGIATVLFGMGGSAPEQPDWKIVGEILLKAFFR